MESPKVWLITGTSSGFGRRLVSIVLARGDRVIASSRTLASITDPEFFELNDASHASNLYRAELDIATGTAQVKERIDAMVEASGWGTVDVLVNNAGLGITGFLEEGGVDLMRRQYQTNVFGTLDVTNAVLPFMHRQNSGTVVMIGSRSGWRTEIKGIGFYGSSKAALHAMAEALAMELEPLGIRTLIVEPGAFRTEGIHRYPLDDANKIANYDKMREETAAQFEKPKGKQPGDPEKAMKALVDVVCGEGRAQGKEWPLYLVLGKDAERDVRTKCARMIKHLDEWNDVVRDVDLDYSGDVQHSLRGRAYFRATEW